jgi:DeoR family ulaG and ulaABCDEF operon transcriptional repressor
MHARERHRLIERAASEQGLVTVEELTAQLGASPATIRRDLAILAGHGRLRRVRGGVEPARTQPPATLLTAPFQASSFLRREAKLRIARRAAVLCAPGESIIVNGGTTTYCMADFIAPLGLNVLTNSFPLASHLLSSGTCRVTVPGGEVYREQNIILSAYERDTAIDHFYASKMFMGALAIRAHGLIEGDPILIKTEQKLLRQADELIVLVDGSKFEPRGSLILCDLERISLLITDGSAPPDALAMLERRGVRVEVVAEEEREAAS